MNEQSREIDGSKPLKKQLHKKKGVLRFFLWFLLIAGVIVIAAGIYVYSYLTATYQGSDTVILIPKGATESQILESLQSALGKDMGNKVYTIWGYTGGKTENAPGLYRIKNGTRSLDIARYLRRGAPIPVKITFNNARTLEDVAKKITVNTNCTAEEFLGACDRILPEKGYSPDMVNAAFLPNTYEVYWDETGDQIVNRLLKEKEKFWNEERKEKAQALGLTPDEVTILASIVEEESNKADEWGTIGRLYLNRLQKGWKLQADPTIKFALGDPTIKRIYEKDFTVDSPYNTYMHKGLPPGPLRVVSPQSIDAILDAPDHKYMYMCAKEDFSGYHNFAIDLATHNRNSKKYRDELNRRGIR